MEPVDELMTPRQTSFRVQDRWFHDALMLSVLELKPVIILVSTALLSERTSLIL
jgi:hypothetical protein